MNEKFTVRKANENDMPGIQNMIKGLAEYEKRPQDMTASQEDLCHWIFEKKIATALIAEYNNEAPSDMQSIIPCLAHLLQRQGCIWKICF